MFVYLKSNLFIVDVNLYSGMLNMYLLNKY